MINFLQTLSIILVRPQYSGNLGSVARAMKNMGLRDLRLVSPKAKPDSSEAHRMALHASDILHQAKTFHDLAEALSEFDLVVGTTRRTGKERDNVATLRNFVSQVKASPQIKKIAVLFGAEDTGLHNEELAHCQRIVYIPSHQDYPSLNLSQAVMVLAYEWFVSDATIAMIESSQEDLADFASIESMYQDLESLLDESGFLNPQNPFHAMRIMRNLINRASPSEREIRTLRGIFRQLRWWKERG
ncbi:MAG: RNA methyltransferase [Deltaproteobacteria bacterium]|nr:RNA methyltransferase [Deltaproteobacteria bacterium]